MDMALWTRGWVSAEAGAATGMTVTDESYTVE